VSERDRQRPAFTEDDASKILESVYGLKGSLTEMPSERDRNFHLFSSAGDEYILKIAAESESELFLELQNDAMNHLTENLSCPRVIPSKEDSKISEIESNEGKRHFVRLLTYIPGRVFAEFQPHSQEVLTLFGRFVGQISHGLTSFSHSAAERDFYWDLKNASDVISKYKGLLEDDVKRSVVELVMSEFEEQVLPRMSDLRKSVIHNDANDYNIVVNWPLDLDTPVFGLLDFGDMVNSCTVFELAVAVTYAILDTDDPISAAADIIKGYNEVFPLHESEVAVLFTLIRTRLAMSVAIAAYQVSLEPENEYLKISQRSVWRLLQRLQEVHHRLATYIFRDACGFAPCPHSETVLKWLADNRHKIGPISDHDLPKTEIAVIDLSVGSLEFQTPADLLDVDKFSKAVQRVQKESGAELVIGRYDEPRLIYSGEQYETPSTESRTVHIAIDLFLKSGSHLYAPLDGRVHSFKNNRLLYDNGPTIVLEHRTEPEGQTFYTLYSHLSEDSLNGLEVGRLFKKGEQFAEVGTYPTNGGWPPHLHFQLIMDMFDWEGDYYGVALASQREVWKSISPSPNTLLGLPESMLRDPELSSEEILSLRKQVIGPSLSISYKIPLKMVRGSMQYLYDDLGRKYLDCRNNVPHVGHSHPHVVKAIQRQASVLNTNTRYLHSLLVKYAKRLVETLPEPLRVCYFVNSGSEANELALRLAKTHTGHRDVIVVDGAYHGNTGGLVDISPYKYDGPGGTGAPEHVHKVHTPDAYRGPYKADDSKAGEKYALEIQQVVSKSEQRGLSAFICESLMGCAGQIVLPDGYLKHAFKHTRDAGGVCIVDEVQVGFGRVGTHFWGFEHQDVVPDIVTMGKPMGNGHPIAAVVTTPEIAKSFDTGMEFFSTYGGNQVSCAAGMAVLDVIKKDELQKNALEIGTYLMQQLESIAETHQSIGDVRGSGLFIGVELVRDRETLEPATKEAKYLIERLRDLGVLLSTDGPYNNVLKIKPPLVFSREDADFMVQALDKILSEDYISQN
jgi:4-aminobutyrate aminotransferase-like enzyme/Ser/Thr protein kinase RdoA (MazF antagonist)